MSSLRPLTRIRRRRASRTVETLTELLQMLTRERQDLRDTGAGAITLERNRLAIANVQWELSYALIDRHLPAATAQDAA